MKNGGRGRKTILAWKYIKKQAVIENKLFFQLCFRFIGLTALLKQRLFVLTCHESPIIFWFSHWGKCIWKWFKVHPSSPVWMGSHLIISSGRVASPIQEMHSPHETNSDPYNSSSALFSFGLSSSPSNFFSCLVILDQEMGNLNL